MPVLRPRPGRELGGNPWPVDFGTGNNDLHRVSERADYQIAGSIEDQAILDPTPVAMLPGTKAGFTSFDKRLEGVKWLVVEVTLAADSICQPCVSFDTYFHFMLRLLVCGNRFFRSVGYRGDIGIDLTLRNMQDQRMVFIPVGPGNVLGENDYRSFEDVLTGRQIVAAENLEREMNRTLQSIISQVCWSFWQSTDPFPNDELGRYLERMIRDMGRL